MLNKLQIKPQASDLSFLIEENNKKPSTYPIPLVSTYAEEKRILPPDTPFPGYWDNARTPYAVEIMDCLSPFSPIQKVAAMKAAQTALTATAENVIGYWMDESPAKILYISATAELLEKWATARLEPLIDSCGFRHKIYAQTENKASRRTGDKIFSKEFVGGGLNMASARSASGLRSDSVRILICDEIDGAPALLTTGEGNWLKVAVARTKAWGSRKKIFFISTPTTFEMSLIYREYEAGDQRKYLVPCPHCGKFQELRFGGEKSEYGLKPETKGGKLVKAYYQCEHCRDAIFNYHKGEMLKNGRWEPSTTSNSEFFRSYHISGLYSPPGMYSWTEMLQEYYEAEGDEELMRAFVNLSLGKPFKETGTRPKIETVIELRGLYRSGTIPDGVIYLTMGIDVQRGSLKDPNNPPRLEYEILGIGTSYKTWSIRYGRIEGEVDDPASGAWEKLNEFAMAGGLSYKRSDGRDFGVELIFIDSGDGNLTDVVYQFTSQWSNTFPSKGFSALKRQKGEKTDEMGPSNFKRYRAQKLNDMILYEISTNYYKGFIYNKLKVKRSPTEFQNAGFCDFPIDYSEKYFKMLTAEEKRSDGSFHCPSGRRNEALDCRAMALSAADAFLAKKVMDARVHVRSEGATMAQAEQITFREVIIILEGQTKRKIKQ